MKTNIYLFLAMVIMLLAGCNNKKTETTEPTADSTATAMTAITFTDEQIKMADLAFGTVEQRALGNVLKLSGRVEARPGAAASVSAPFGGYIKWTKTLPGQAVARGQVLATISSPEFIDMQQQYLENSAQLTYLRQEYERQKLLRNHEVNAAKTLQKTVAELRTCEARLSGLRARLVMAGISPTRVAQGKITAVSTLRSPISGNVKTVNVNQGKYVAPEDVLFEIENTSDLHLALHAFEKDLAQISTGQTVRFSLAKEASENRVATVYMVGRSSDEDGQALVFCRTASTQGLVPGMYVKAYVELGCSKQTAVPSEAIVQMEGKDYLLRTTDLAHGSMRFDFIQVKTGIEENGWTAVTLTSALKSTDRIVTKNAYLVFSALKSGEEEE